MQLFFDRFGYGFLISQMSLRIVRIAELLWMLLCEFVTAAMHCELLRLRQHTSSMQLDLFRLAVDFRELRLIDLRRGCQCRSACASGQPEAKSTLWIEGSLCAATFGGGCGLICHADTFMRCTTRVNPRQCASLSQARATKVRFQPPA